MQMDALSYRIASEHSPFDTLTRAQHSVDTQSFANYFPFPFSQEEKEEICNAV